MSVALSPVNVPSPDQVRTRAKLSRARKLARMQELESLILATRGVAGRKTRPWEC